jgi:hypothetical protein
MFSMSKIAAVLLPLLFVFSMTACGAAEETSKPTPTVTVTAEPEPSIDQTLVDLVRKEYPELYGVTDAQIIELGKTACDAFDAGASAEDIIMAIPDTDPQTRLALAYVVGAGVGAYCPEYTGLFTPSTNS